MKNLFPKRQLLFLIDDPLYCTFGYYLNTEIIKKYYLCYHSEQQLKNNEPNYIRQFKDMNGFRKGLYSSKRQPTDDKTFHFTLSWVGSFRKPMKYEIKDVEIGGIHLCNNLENNYPHHLIMLGIFLLNVQSKNYNSYVNSSNSKNSFEYHGIETPYCTAEHSNCRLRVIQMK